jgi:hypothetical protein
MLCALFLLKKTHKFPPLLKFDCIVTTGFSRYHLVIQDQCGFAEMCFNAAGEPEPSSVGRQLDLPSVAKVKEFVGPFKCASLFVVSCFTELLLLQHVQSRCSRVS